MSKGMFIGVGLGPGDPDLVTIRAARLIAETGIIAYPSLPGTESFARQIAAPYIADDTHEIVVEVPMTLDRGPAQAAYDLGAARIAEALDLGHDVVMLCEGDPFFYGSFMYLHARLSGRYATDVVPGVTSVSAASARAQLPLVARNDAFSTIPAPLSDDAIRNRIAQADSVAILKVGRHLGRVRALLAALGLLDRAQYIERATLDNERILPLSEAPDPAPYFSLILVTKGADPWLKTPS
ncbi:precorrin-2 C(20)-methyltransferase [Maritimibacter sp. HL-12]|uniref:precorrin-2 C(20)-methyltransferase n=1 Tax=Maritimibacter sp. HL-12 TaxID=1162418 RepID=UPI000A0F1043|nr:precorrin-2 C(20)-methyltransferase [Maritimibacter sp. HL-12]SMH41166.1 precorrin-2/cobalt-factor-2 C20-methyltransferase [Maritimibacter sp. HL-12]